MTVSIIIAVKTWQKNLEECIQKCRELDFADFEILALPDLEVEGQSPSETVPLGPKGTVSVRIIPTGRVSPAQKRDMAVNYALGEILAFIDDDACPAKDWLKNAVKNFLDPQVAAVGGPAMTPEDDNLRQKASGLIYSSPLVSAEYVYRYLPKKKIEVHDYPSCNFLMRKSIMQGLGGFKTNFWPGEDTKLCLDITKTLNKKIVYDPTVIVYHHRRPLFLSHLKQVASYAFHRGYFVKKYPETSLRISYFIPSIFLLFLLTGAIFSLFLIPLRIIYLFVLSLYIILVFIFSIIGTVLNPCYQTEGFILSEAKDLQGSGLSLSLLLFILVFFGIILTHLTYGFYFLKGLTPKKLKEEL